MEMLREQRKQLQLLGVAKVNATACAQTGCSGLGPAPELFPSGSGCRNLALRAFMNKPYPFLGSYLISPFAELDAHNCQAKTTTEKQGTITPYKWGIITVAGWGEITIAGHPQQLHLFLDSSTQP
jgi:hypothetical protein